MVIPGRQGHLQSVVVGTESDSGLSDKSVIRKLGVVRSGGQFGRSIGSASGVKVPSGL